MKIHVVKALWRSTSTTVLIRARNSQHALDKAAKLKELKEALEFQYLGIRDDENPNGIERNWTH